MNDDNGAQEVPAQPQPGQPPMMKISCSQCTGEMIVQVPAFRFFNHPDVSGLVFTHTRVNTCPQCGAKYVCLLGGIDGEGHIMLSWTPVQTKESAILPPTEQNMQQAITTAKMGNKLKTN